MVNQEGVPITGGGVGALLGRWRKVADEDQRIVVCYETGYDGFWLSITGQARNLEKRGDTARLRAVRHAIALALPGLRVQERARREVLRRLAASRLRRLPVQRRPSCPRPLAPIAPSVVISQSCFVISWARRRWPHGSTRRTGDPLGSRRKGLPPLDPHLFCTNLKYIRCRTRVVQRPTRSMPLRFGAP